MAYRRTERESVRLAARYDAIIKAARALASESGLRAIQIAPVAERAGVAAGTVYRHFPSKEDLVAAVVSHTAEREVAAIRSRGGAGGAFGACRRSHRIWLRDGADAPARLRDAG
jgi:AcrR family transcriptional regulator